MHSSCVQEILSEVSGAPGWVPDSRCCCLLTGGNAMKFHGPKWFGGLRAVQVLRDKGTARGERMESMCFVWAQESRLFFSHFFSCMHDTPNFPSCKLTVFQSKVPSAHRLMKAGLQNYSHMEEGEHFRQFPSAQFCRWHVAIAFSLMVVIGPCAGPPFFCSFSYPVSD